MERPICVHGANRPRLMHELILTPFSDQPGGVSVKTPVCLSFRGVRHSLLADDEESRTALKTIRARFLAPLGMTPVRSFHTDSGGENVNEVPNEPEALPLESVPIRTISLLPGVLAFTRRIITGAFITILVGFVAISAVAAPQKQAQAPESPEQDRASDWASDNLERVSASVAQIRAVLTKDPGLLVELKRLMAKQATEKGQSLRNRT